MSYISSFLGTSAFAVMLTVSIVGSASANDMLNNSAYAHIGGNVFVESGGANGGQPRDPVLSVGSVSAGGTMMNNDAYAYIDGPLTMTTTVNSESYTHIGSTAADGNAQNNSSKAVVDGAVWIDTNGNGAVTHTLVGSITSSGNAYNNTAEAYIDGDLVHVNNGTLSSVLIGSLNNKY